MKRSVWFLGVVVSSLALGCPGQRPPVAAPPASAQIAPPPPAVVWRMSKSGLGFRISDPDDANEQRPSAKSAKATPLTADETKKVIDRLPAMTASSDDVKDFALRDKSLPAPRPGKTINDAFPPPASPPPPPPAAKGPLTVTRHAPDGAVDLAPNLTVSFSLPMIAVTSHDDLSRTPPPVKITPAPPGKWRWLGTQTVMFQPDARFPMATEYRVEVPAGTRAANGQTLATAVTWTFKTPAPKALTTSPSGGPVLRDPIVFVEFDQKIDPAAMLRSIDLVGPQSTLVPVQMATADEIEANETARRLVQRAEADRWLALRPVSKLPTNTSFATRVNAGAPSAEGPRRTDRQESTSFQTYGPMRVSASSCGWRNECRPMNPFHIEFSNPIDTKSFDKGMVTIDPPIAGVKVLASYSDLTITGRTRGRTHYTVTVKGAIGDTFGQTMEKDHAVTFDVGPAAPVMFTEESEMNVLDPSSPPTLPVFSVNEPGLDVKIYSVKPDDWARYEKFRADWDQDDKRTTPPGKLVFQRTIRPKADADELVETPIDLSSALAKSGTGQAIVLVEPTLAPPKGYAREWLRTWVQVTRIGLQAYADGDQLVGWTTALSNGTPLEGVDVSLLKAGTAKSGADGLARIALTDRAGTLLFAKKGDDVAILPEPYTSESSFTRQMRGEGLRWFSFDDRQIYKPGEEGHVKGWIRKVGLDKGGDVSGIADAAGKKITWILRDARWSQIAAGATSLDANAGFDVVFKVPQGTNLGQGHLTFTLETPIASSSFRSHDHAVQIQEFRRPDFEVNATAEPGSHFVGGHAIATVAATYFAGGGLAEAPVDWTVTRSDAYFTPPNRSEYTFGKRAEWWWHPRSEKKEKTQETWAGKTHAGGDHRIRIDFDALDPAFPMNLALEASVTDVNRQAWSARTSLLVHPADVMVGLKQERAFVRAGEALQVDTIVTDIEGKAVARRSVTAKAARIEWERKGDEYVETEVDVETCDVESTEQAVRCALKTKEAGRYRVSAVVTDLHGRKSRTEMHVWVIGDSSPPDRELGQGRVELIGDKEQYKVGDTAELLVVAPFFPAEGVLTVRRQGLVKIERFRALGTTSTVKVKVDEALVPGAQIVVDLVGADVRTDLSGERDPKLPKRPAFASGSIAMKIPAVGRTLKVSAVPRDKTTLPGAKTAIDLELRDSDDRPVAGGELAVVVVDEAVLALTGYKLPDPISAFYTPPSADVRAMMLREHVLVARPDDRLLSQGANRRLERGRSFGHDSFGYGGLGGLGVVGGASPRATAFAKVAPAPAASAAPMQPGAKPALVTVDEIAITGKEPEIAVRSDFSALAAFMPRVTTDAAGRAQVPLRLPDSLTRYRVMAVATAKDNWFGATESGLTARLPLMVRPSAPRFLNYGDRFELPIVVQNQTEQPLETFVVARAQNAQMIESVGRRVTVPANDRVEVRLPAAAAQPGTARFQVGAASGRYSDASEIELPVWTPATTEAFATYGAIDQGAIAQPVKLPPGVAPQFGGVEITTSSTALQSLTDAVLYLVRYPFECNEQLASRVIAVSALRDVLTAFKAEGLPKPEAMIASVKKDLERLKSRQHYTGGWAFWHGDREPVPYLSVHVAHALVRAKAKGFAVDADMLRNAQNFLRYIESHIPSWYSVESRRAIVSYALYVRKRMGDADPVRAQKLVADAGGVEKLSMESLGWLLPTFSEDKASGVETAAIRKHFANRVSETAGAAHFTTSYTDGAQVLLASDRRADGVILESLIGVEPQSDLIPKLVTGLLAHRKAGRWTSTQENAFVLLALDRYFNAYEKATPDFVARAWLGDRYAGEHAFKGYSADRQHIDIPLSFLAGQAQPQNVLLQKDGAAGRLYYRIGMQYAPSDLRPPPMDQGFTVTRVYEGAEKAEDVTRDPDGAWHMKAGAKVRVRLNMIATSRRYHVALVDPIPAGLEAMNTALAVTGSIPQDPKAAEKPAHWFWTNTWYEHQNMRDERVEAFASLLWEGVYDYTYVARATTPGTFVVPPPKAEEMYSPETFGRGAGDKVIVE